MQQRSLLELRTTPKNFFFGLEQRSNYADLFGEKLKACACAYEYRPKVLSLFSGAGGLDIGFHDAGFHIVEAVEIEQFCAATLAANTGKHGYFGQNLRITCGDIKEYFPTESQIDFIVGGPPCQSFSAAGARAEGVAGTKDDRGRLFLEYVRVLQILKPKGFLFENVSRMVGANKGKDWDKIVESFSRAGYNLFFRVLDTADFGVPQHRERLLIVGLRKDLFSSKPFLFPRPTHGPESFLEIPHISSKEALAGLVEDKAHASEGISGKYGHLLAEIPPGLNYSFFTEKMGHPSPIFAWRSKFSDFLYKADPLKPVRTIKAQGGQYTGPFHWNNRPFTIKELKRLQSFPDAYTVTGSRLQIVNQLGNSVPPQFARILALSVLEQVFDFHIPVSLQYLSLTDELQFRKRKRDSTKLYQATALFAVSKLTAGTTTSTIDSGCFNFSIDEKFNYHTGEDGDYSVKTYEKNRYFCIDLKSNTSCNNEKNLFEITVHPKNNWILQYDYIKLRSYVYGIKSYTALWKTFDYLLYRDNIKADLVQLCGYYQYEPNFSQSLSIFENSFEDASMAHILEHICSEKITRKSYSMDYLSTSLNMDKKDILAQLLSLKNNGYEIRSSGTNISLNNDSYLIPYAFPTLTPMSVQRTKRL